LKLISKGKKSVIGMKSELTQKHISTPLDHNTFLEKLQIFPEKNQTISIGDFHHLNPFQKNINK
jgi:hypothetical protein